MEEQITEFQYFVDLFWVFFVGALAVRIICGHIGEGLSWVRVSFGGSPQH